MIDEGNLRPPNEPGPKASPPGWLFASTTRKIARILFILWFWGVVMLAMWLVTRAV